MELLRLNRNVKNCSRRCLRWLLISQPLGGGLLGDGRNLGISPAGDENLLGAVGVGGFPISAKRERKASRLRMCTIAVMHASGSTTAYEQTGHRPKEAKSVNDHPEYPPTHPDQEPSIQQSQNSATRPATHQPIHPAAEPIGSDRHPDESPNPDKGSEDNSLEPTDQIPQHGLTARRRTIASRTRQAPRPSPPTQGATTATSGTCTPSWANDRGIDPIPRQTLSKSPLISPSAPRIHNHKPATLRAAAAAIAFVHKARRAGQPLQLQKSQDTSSAAPHATRGS